MSIVSRRQFLEAGIALSASSRWAETARSLACSPSFTSVDFLVDKVVSDDKGKIVPFRIAVPQSKLDRIAARVRDTEFPMGLGEPDSWQYGLSRSVMRKVVDCWVATFDWRKAEAALNRYPQFLAQVGGFNIHFYHVAGTGPKPFPIILTHCWPGSVFEFLGTVDRLRSDGFSLVIPSLPGFGFSSRAAKGPVGPVTTAGLAHLK